MRKVNLLFLLSSFFLLSNSGFGQNQLVRSFTFTTAESKASIDVSQLGLNYYKIQWATRGDSLPSACTIVLQTSNDNTNWSTGISGTCTSNSASAVTTLSTPYVRLNLSSYAATAGNASLIVTIVGNSNSIAISGGGDASAANQTSEIGLLTTINAAVVDTTPVAVYTDNCSLKRYISVGITEDESQVKATAGTLCGISAYNVNASANAFIKCTNLTAANTTPGTSAIFYSMMVPFGGGYVDNKINVDFSVALTCYIVLGKADNAVDEVAADDVGYDLRYR